MSKTRAAYYLLLIALLMPALPEGNTSSQQVAPVKSVAVEDVAGASFCANPHGLCGATSYLLRKLEAKAKYPIHVLNNWSSHTSAGYLENRA